MAELYITISVIFKSAGYSNNCTEQRFELQCIRRVCDNKRLFRTLKMEEFKTHTAGMSEARYIMPAYKGRHNLFFLEHGEVFYRKLWKAYGSGMACACLFTGLST
ncbi:hypothetical protein BANRA_05393 [Escherichia coli]|nr:hypothetical protein BANRA_05393 [Escherichia coli]